LKPELLRLASTDALALNRHLFQSTQPEKYATLFLGFYDDQNIG